MALTEDQQADLQTIGGHFSAIVDEHDFPPPGRYGYESARSCLYALIREVGARRVHIPNYICDAVPKAIAKADCAMEPYAIGRDFEMSGTIDFQDGDLILLVNYYGLCAASIERQLAKLPCDAVVVDNSQAYFQSPFPCLANIYSPRKFLPVPDGGFIETAVTLSQEPADEDASFRRIRSLLKRVGSEPQGSRADYLAAENSLEMLTLRAMSALTRALARATDQELIVRRRRENFRAFADMLGINELGFDLGNQVPLTYPLLLKNGREVRSSLIGKRVFTPTYWPNIDPINEFESLLSNDTVFLPIDHRYDAQDIKYIYDVLSLYL
jgi:hypothetical protein